ncbi:MULTISPECIES: ATP-binding protein [Rathayibacter]|uniref:ATP-binding protein n=1 Tax=Rathayibacter festucae DSM 15932 TaxID=1328866 RepID=A0A3Q9UZJ8_9MICO|nr:MULTISPECIES: ATP-binding protein [Rathayibacter]AZZ52925.1 ATP-binding protein [Rathayibacter festucae DSM 15932]MCJ1686806.1 ATP-binding protein [Rathayibacter sp. VKM Ac-2927]MCJ1701501.1 ATP-binding protein [Rathayibacter festucae]ROQ60655.1 serine/threonine-protein kinase RsbW [Rathayibacter sp. PhB152]TDX77503.1 serine/threonine-protein kinase RsbW [Rathayibacter sp. PhB151]
MTERTLAFRTPPDDIELVHDLLDSLFGERADVGARDRMEFETALVELVSNVIQHAVSTTAVLCRLVVTVDDEALRAELVDTADPPGVDTGPREMPDAFAESGRGIALIQALVTDFDYERTASRNLWSIRKDRALQA